MFQLSSQECPSFFGSALGSTEEIHNQSYTPKLTSELSLESSSNHSWPSEKIFKEGGTPVYPDTNVGEGSLHTEFENNVFPYEGKLSSNSSSILEDEPESNSIGSQKELIWIDQSNDVLSGRCHQSNDSSPCLEDIDGVRKRLEKRKRRSSTKNLRLEGTCETKRVRNTIAARRYRERRQKELEILDKKVKELEQDLNTSKMETKWWQMEAQRWRELAEKRERE